MSFRKTGARLASSLSTWGLKTLAHRPAANMPGKIALKIDPDIISEEMSKIAEGSIVVVGTNGKTTVTNMIADAIEASGKTVACNRTGANMAYGVAATLLQTEPADWGVFESDELWLARILPQVKATYVVLLNLFRDQLDRCGETAYRMPSSQGLSIRPNPRSSITPTILCVQSSLRRSRTRRSPSV